MSRATDAIGTGVGWLGQKLHGFRHVVNDVVKFEMPRNELADSLGWQRALRMGLPDWYRAYPADTLPQSAPQLEEALQEQFAARAGTVRTAATSLSYLLHAANDPCHHHTAEEAAKHEAKKDQARALLKPITEALTAHTGFDYQDTSLLQGFRVGGLGGIKIPGQTDRTDTKALALLKHLATEHDDTKGLLSRWHFETARSVAAPNEKGLLNNAALNITAAALMAAGGGVALTNTAQHMTRPLERHETPLSRLADAASTAAIVLGAFPYGKAVSLAEKSNPSSRKNRQRSDTLMGVHGSTEIVVTGGNSVHGVVTGGEAAATIGVKEITDSMADFFVTPKAVNITNTAQDALWDMADRRSGNRSPKREKYRHDINGVGAVMGTAALSNVNMALAAPLLAAYGAVYGVTMLRKLPNIVKQGAQRAAEAIRQPGNGLLKRVQAGAAAVGIAAAGLLGIPGRLERSTMVPPPAPDNMETVQNVDLTPQQAASLLEAYTSPAVENLQDLQGMGGSAAGMDTYKPYQSADYVKRAEELTNMPADTLEQAKQNVAVHTQNTYEAMARLVDTDENRVACHFHRQYRDSGQNTPRMIADTIEEWQELASSDNASPLPQSQRPAVDTLFADMQSFQERTADKHFAMPNMLDAAGRELVQRSLDLLKKGYIRGKDDMEQLRTFIASEIFERGNSQITGGDIVLANILLDNTGSNQR